MSLRAATANDTKTPAGGAGVLGGGAGECACRKEGGGAPAAPTLALLPRTAVPLMVSLSDRPMAATAPPCATSATQKQRLWLRPCGPAARRAPQGGGPFAVMNAHDESSGGACCLALRVLQGNGPSAVPSTKLFTAGTCHRHPHLSQRCIIDERAAHEHELGRDGIGVQPAAAAARG